MGPQPLGSRYLLEEQIGQGGMGVVWRGRDRETGDYCAVKLLRPEFAADPGAVTRFVRERTALIKFRHPNVVSLRDMIVEGDYLALVMDFVGGGDLATYRRNRGGGLPLGDALGMTAQICDALAAAHAAGIVHRDLKPANVLLDAGQVKLADFGIARIVGESPATTTGTVMGTIAFMAPEVIRGEPPTPACDVYAAGITLYELLTGTQPFTGQVVAIMHAHLDTTPPRPAGMPDRLWAVVSACLAKDPGARPPADLLARALRDPALLAEPWPSGQPAPYGQLRGAHGAPSTSGASLAAGVSGGQSAGGAYGGGWAQRSGPVTSSAVWPAAPADGTSSGYAMTSGPSVSSAYQLTTGHRMPAVTTGDPLLAGGAVAIAPPPGQTEVPVGPASPETEVRAVGIGVADSPSRPGGRGGHRGTGPRPLWAAVAALALVFAGVAGTYLVMHGSGKSAGPQALSPAASTQASSIASGSLSATEHPSSPARSPTPTASRSSVAASATGQSTAAGTGPSATPAAKTTAPVPAGTPGPTGPNLVSDGDFSDASLSAWNNLVWNTTVVSGGVDGQNAAQMTANPTAGIDEIISGLTAGRTYELTGYSLSESGGTYIGVKEYDSTGGKSRINNLSSWSEVGIDFTVGAGDSSADIFCWQSVVGTGYCSDIQVHVLG